MAMVTSIVRTVVPYVVGALVTLGAGYGIDIPADALTEVTTPVVAGVVGAVYYAVARFAEEHLGPIAQRVGGFMLFSRRKPTYDKPHDTAA